MNQSEMVSVFGHELYASLSGDGRPLLLINGLGGNLENWEPLRDALDCRTLAFDAPGAGRSPSPRLPVPIPRIARLAVGLLDELGIEGEVDVLGVSMGGIVAQQVAIAYPERVRKLVLASTTWGFGGIPGDPRAFATLMSPLRFIVPGLFKHSTSKMVGGRTSRDTELAERYRASRVRPPFGGFLKQLSVGTAWSTLFRAHQIVAPTLVISGDDDPLIPPINSKILSKVIPNAKLEIIEGAGHLAVVDEMHLVGPMLAKFLDH
ncbi:alpha/beta fold hydrolase [Pseudomaricurvus alkylphenolicus]|uniref:alpha/beta fold hydrolase n=1 Tax=Pseudomaricurvus alkylphenolicus TaxID=1306991 RepID=UPI001422A7FD|nr:alpha/beta fold hydrolase [Pseudomaricurvus alkylphenolicus]NIB40503.1 alpha/beta fold hydrolase [Pseudomaricurvus alkylphenolicus]